MIGFWIHQVRAARPLRNVLFLYGPSPVEFQVFLNRAPSFKIPPSEESGRFSFPSYSIPPPFQADSLKFSFDFLPSPFGFCFPSAASPYVVFHWDSELFFPPPLKPESSWQESSPPSFVPQILSLPRFKCTKVFCTKVNFPGTTAVSIFVLFPVPSLLEQHVPVFPDF